jgi:hypothetical protein
MKKLNLAVSCLILFALGSTCRAAADDAAGPGPLLGIEGGIDLANLNGQNANDVVGSRLGFVGGVFVNVPFGPTLGLQPEVLYEQKGGKYNGNPYQLDYTEVPILLNVTLLGPLGILLGPAFDVNVANKGAVHVNSTDVSLIAGAQLNLSRIILSGRYEVGLTNASSTQNIQTGTFTFLLGLSLI